MTNNDTLLLTVEEVANKLKVSARTVQKHLRDGVLNGKKIGKRWYISVDTLVQQFAQ